MGEYTTCDYCHLKRHRREAKKKNCRIVLRQSDFMGELDVFEVEKGVKLPKHYIEPCDKFPNGDYNYQKYHRAWMMRIPDHCYCY